MRHRVSKWVSNGILVGIVFLTLSCSSVLPGNAPQAKILWQYSQGGTYFGTFTNLSPETLSQVQIRVTAPVPVEHAGFNLGSQENAFYAYWPSGGSGPNIQDERLRSSLAAGGVLQGPQPTRRKDVSPGVQDGFQLDAPKLTFPPAVEVTDGQGNSVSFTQELANGPGTSF